MIFGWDDERNPGDSRIQELFGAQSGMVWGKTADIAIARLKSGSVRWISLEYDLGTRATEYDVAKWIEARAYGGELRGPLHFSMSILES